MDASLPAGIALRLRAREALAAQHAAIGNPVPATVWTAPFEASPALRALACAMDTRGVQMMPAPPLDAAAVERLWESFNPDDVPQLTRRKLRAALRKAGLLE